MSIPDPTSTGIPVASTGNSGPSGRPSNTTANPRYLNYERYPGLSDNASKGVTTSSVWQAFGEIFIPSTPPDNTGGAWAAQVNNKGAAPGAVMGANGVCIGGVRQLVPGFTGPAITLTAIVATVSTPTDINILANGRLDVEAAEKVLASADAGTIPEIRKIYDQSGNGNDLVWSAIAGKIARGPYLIWVPSVQDFMIGTDEVPGANAQGIQFPSTLALTANNMGFYAFGTGITSVAGINTAMVASFGTGTTTAVTLHVGESALGPTLASWAATSGGKKPATANIIPLSSRPCVVSLSCANGATGYTIGCNERKTTIAFTAPSTALTGGLLGSWDFDNVKYSAMRFWGFAVMNATPTATQDRKIRNWAYAEFNILPQARDRLFFLCDSRGTLTGAPAASGKPGNNIATVLSEMLNADCEIINTQQVGYTSSNIGAIFIPGIVATCSPFYKTFVLSLYGVNDFGKAFLTPEQSIANIKANNDALNAAGCTTIQISELSTTLTTGAAAVNVPLLRDLIKAGKSGANYVINVDDITLLMTPTNTVIYPDGLHESETGVRMIVPRCAALLDSLMSLDA